MGKMIGSSFVVSRGSYSVRLDSANFKLVYTSLHGWHLVA